MFPPSGPGGERCGGQERADRSVPGMHQRPRLARSSTDRRRRALSIELFFHNLLSAALSRFCGCVNPLVQFKRDGREVFPLFSAYRFLPFTSLGRVYGSISRTIACEELRFDAEREKGKDFKCPED